MKKLFVSQRSARRLTRFCASALALATMVAVSTSALAAGATYDGGDATNSNFSKADNWSGNTTPNNGDDLNFGTAAVPANRLSPNNNNFLTSVGSITFYDTGGQSYTITGSPVSLTGSNVISNTGSLTQTVSFGGTGITLTGSTLFETQSGALNITSKINTQGNGLRLLSPGGGQITLSGNITGTPGLGISIGQTGGAAGNVLLSGNNSGLSDNINLLKGTLTIGSNNALGTADLLVDGSNVDTHIIATDASHTISTGINSSVDFSIAPTGTLKVNGLLTLANGTTVTVTNDTNVGEVVFNGGIAGGGANGITLQGADPAFYYGITISGGTASTYTGKLNVAGGAFLKLDVNPANGAVTGDLDINGASYVQLEQSNQIADSSTVTIHGGNEFDLNGFNETVESITGGGTVELGTSGQLTVNSGTFTGYLTDISGGKLVHNGTGTFTLSGTSDYSGNTVINGGTIASGATNSLSANSRFEVNQNGTLSLNGFDNTISNLDDNDGIGGLVQNGGSSNATLTFGDSNNSNFHGSIQDGSTGTLSLVKQGTGNFTLSGTNNTYSGTTTINDGEFRAGAVNAFSANSTVLVNSGGTLALEGFDNTIGNLTDNDNIGGVVKNDGATNAVLTLGGAVTSFQFDTFHGNIKDGAGGGNLGLVKEGAGALVLAGNNTYSGDTVINNGSIYAGSNNGLSNNSLFRVNSGGLLAVAGTNSTILNLSDDGTGGTVENGSNTDAKLTFGDANNTTFHGYITDGGNPLTLVKQGTGTFTLAGSSDYSGKTFVNAGTFAAGATNALSSNSRFEVNQNGTLSVNGYDNTISNLDDSDGIGGLVNNGSATDATLTFGDGNDSNFHGAIQNGSSGTLGITKQGSGTFTLSGTNNTYTGATIVTEGTFKAGADNAFSASSDLTVDSPATVLLASHDETVNSLNGDGTVNLVGGTLTISNGGGFFNGYLTGNNHGSLVIDNNAGFEQEGTSDYGGDTTIKSGYIWATSTNSLSANSRYVIDSGATLYLSSNETIGNLGDDGVGGSIEAYYANAVLTVGDNRNGTFNGTIQDGEGGTVALTKVGTGKLRLTGNNTFSGPVTIVEGQLRVGTNSLGQGNVNLQGGELGSIYTGSATLVNIGNNFTQTGGDLRVRVYSPTTNGNDTYDVLGSFVTLGALSNLELTFPFGGGSVSSNTTYEIIHNAAGNINGTFGSVTGLNNFTLDPGQFATIVYVPTDVYLAIRTYLGDTPGLTPNQTEIARNLDSLAGIATSGNYGTVVNALYNLPANEIGGALDQLSPEKFGNFASTTAFNNASFATQAMDSYLNGRHGGNNGTFASTNGMIDSSGLTVNDPNYDPSLAMVHSRLLAWNPAPYSGGLLSDTPSTELGGVDMKDSKNAKEMIGAAYDNPWSVFISGNVILAQGFSQNDVPHFGSNTESVTVGADYRISKNFIAGVTLGYGHTDATLDNNGSNATVDSYSPGVYAAYANKGWYANFYGAYTHNAYTENRNVPFLGGMAHGAPEGNQGVVSLDGGYEFHTGALTYGPMLGIQYTHLTVGGYSEDGSITSLNVAQDQADSLRSRLGGRVSYALKWGNVAITPHLDASWQHEFMDQSRGITSTFSTFGAGSFTVFTPNPSRESALVDFGVSADLNSTVTVFTDYMAQAGQDNYFGQSVQAGVKIGF